MSIAQVITDVAAASRAKDMFSEALSRFEAACIVGAWDTTEAARAALHDSVDAYCDHLALAHKAVKRA